MLQYVTPSMKRRIDGKTYIIFPQSFFDRELVLNMSDASFRDFIENQGNVLTLIH